MSLPKILVWFTSDDYDAIKSLAPQDPKLPDAFDDWLKLATDEITELGIQGIAFRTVIINSHGLSAYCNTSGVNPDSVGRGAYAVYLDRYNHDRGAKST